MTRLYIARSAKLLVLAVTASLASACVSTPSIPNYQFAPVSAAPATAGAPTVLTTMSLEDY